MDWSALLGGFIGAGIPAWLAYLGLRRQRQERDAEAFGPARLLLARLDPDRVSFNVSSDAAVETAKWEDLRKQSETAQERLLVVAAGHHRSGVRRLAAKAQIALAKAFNNSVWQARDMQRDRDNKDWMDYARKTHREATTALQELIDANFAWSALSRHW